MSRLSISDVRSEALFASFLQRSDAPTAPEVQEAIARTIRRYGSRGCTARMAQEFGDAPDAALVRMRWARQLVAAVFAAELPRLGYVIAVPRSAPDPAAAVPGVPSARVPALVSAA